MRLKAFGTALDVAGDHDAAALVSVFDVVDSMRDRVVPGAFAADLAARGATRPVVWSHEHRDPSAFIGTAELLELHPGDERLPDDVVDFGGLLALVTFGETESARAARTAVKSAPSMGWSFAYDVVASAPAEAGVTELLELEVHEVGPCLVGANRAARTLVAKSAADVDPHRALLLAQARRRLGRDRLEQIRKNAGIRR